MSLISRLSFLIFTLFTLILSGCAGAVSVTRLKPAEVALPGVDRITVSGLKGRDGPNLAYDINQKMMESDRYDVLDRDSLNRLIDEQRLAHDSMSAGGLEAGKFKSASALVTGHVRRADYDEEYSREKSTCTRWVKKGDERVKQEYVCTIHRRLGVANYEAHLRVTDAETGEIIAQRLFTKSEKKSTSATDKTAPSIDNDAMISSCRSQVATDFARMIAPYPVQERVRLVKDSKIPEIDIGNTFLKAGDLSSALEHYAAAAAMADGDSSLPPKSHAKAHYAYGIGLAFQGEYDAGLSEMKKALTMAPNKNWIEMSSRVKSFKAEAEELQRQMESAPDDDLSEDESISSTF